MMTEEKDKYIVLFDGDCSLCSHSVQFIIKHDKHDRFRFASLQSPIGQQYLTQFGLPLTDFTTFGLLHKNKLQTKSTAAINVLKYLGMAWSLFYIFIVIPKPIRDAVYSFIAKNRHTIMGHADSCMLPTPELKRKFLS